MSFPISSFIVGGTPEQIGRVTSELRSADLAPEIHIVGSTPPFEALRRGGVVLILLADVGVSRADVLAALEPWRHGPAVIVIGHELSSETVIAAMRHGATDCLDWERIQELGPSVRRAHDHAERKWRRGPADEAAVGERRVLRLIAGGATLSTTLDALVRTIEQQFPAMRCSILLLDETGERLLCGAAPSLPDEYNLAIHGVAIGPDVGSCGTAAFERRRVVVTDIATDPLWSEYRLLAMAHSLRACWSQPIF